MKREAFDHPKFKLLARDLRLPMFAVRGLVESIWLIGSMNFPDGCITWSAEELAIALDYPDDANVMVEALVKRKLLDCMAEGLYIHDWHDHADDFIHMKLARNRQRFANGAMPTLARLSKEQRDKIIADYEKGNENITYRARVRTKPESVRTNKESVRTTLHKSALPEPEPEPEPEYINKSKDTNDGVSARNENLEIVAADDSFLPSHLPVTLSTERIRGLWQTHLAIQAGLGGVVYTAKQVRSLASAVKNQGLNEPQLASCLDALIASRRRVILPQDIRPNGSIDTGIEPRAGVHTPRPSKPSMVETVEQRTKEMAAFRAAQGGQS